MIMLRSADIMLGVLAAIKGAMTRAAHATRNYKRLRMLFARA